VTDADKAQALLRAEFAAEIRARIAALGEALADPNTAAAAEQAHRLKGSALALGLDAVAAEMRAIEAGLACDPPDLARAGVALAAAQVAAERELPVAPEDEGPRAPEAVHGECSHTVLLIEDDPANVRLIEQLFRKRPAIDLVVARSGAEGLEAVNRQRPDLVLLDLGLGDISGVEVLRRLCAVSDPGPPVVVVSGNDSPELRRELVEAGASGFLPKPFATDRLLNLLDGLSSS
jgi:CheY-like chemotaxis protein/HPt (histidine-containing phosphotransfer) domain-containing protein